LSHHRQVKKVTSDSCEGLILLQWKLKFLLISAVAGLAHFEKVAAPNKADTVDTAAG